MSQRSLRGKLPVATALAAMVGCLLSATLLSAAAGAAPAGAVTTGSGIASAVTTSGAPASTMPDPTVPDLASEWWLSALSVPQAWKSAASSAGKPGSGVTVAVVSTGVDATHPDLAGDVVTGPDESGSGRTAGGEFWGVEGTAVASLIAGHGHGPGGAKGTTGVAPGARILSVRATLEYNDPLNERASFARGLPNAIAAGITYAVSHGASVIALPLDPGTLGPFGIGDPAAAGGSAAEQRAVADALAHNVVLIAPAGDNGAGPGTVNYPAAYRGVVAVGAAQRDGALAPYTSRRPYVALTAPGSGLTAAAPGGGYDSLASTDMSAALATGVAALIRSKFPRLTAAQVAEALERGTVPAPGRAARPLPGAGSGALNAVRALQQAAVIGAAASPARAPLASPRPASASAADASARNTSAADASHLGMEAGSALMDAAIGACGLIVLFLLGLLVLTGVRRRRIRAIRARPPQKAQARLGSGRAPPAHAPTPAHAPPRNPALPPNPAQPGTHAAQAGRPPHDNRAAQEAPSEKGASTARHTRSRRSAAKGRGPRGELAASPSPQPRDDPWNPARPPAAGTSADAGQAGRGRNRPRIVPFTKPGALGPSALPSRKTREAADEKPPWETAPIPAAEADPAPPSPQTSLPPWEQAHGQFAAAPVPADMPEWPFGSPVNTGPMYVWNPSATGPIPRIEDDKEENDKPQQLSSRQVQDTGS